MATELPPEIVAAIAAELRLEAPTDDNGADEGAADSDYVTHSATKNAGKSSAEGQASALQQALDLPHIDDETKMKSLEQAQRLADAVFVPMAQKLVELHGVDPATADEETIKRIMNADLTLEQQEALYKVYEEQYERHVAPLVRQIEQQYGVPPPSAAPPHKGSKCARRKRGRVDWGLAVSSAFVGAVTLAMASKLLQAWRQRRRKQKQEAALDAV